MKKKADEMYRYLWSRRLKPSQQVVKKKAEDLRLYYFNQGEQSYSKLSFISGGGIW